MESMLAEQHYLRSPLRPFADLDTHNNNLSLEEKAILAARSQLFLRAAAAAAAGPYAPLMGTVWCQRIPDDLAASRSSLEPMGLSGAFSLSGAAPAPAGGRRWKFPDPFAYFSPREAFGSAQIFSVCASSQVFS